MPRICSSREERGRRAGPFSLAPPGSRLVGSRRGARAPAAALAFGVLLVGACGVPRDLRPPDEDVAREAILAVLSRETAIMPGTAAASRLVVFDAADDGSRITRPMTEAELAELWLPEPIPDVRVEGMNCRFYPVWSVTYRPLTGGHVGPQLVAELVPGTTEEMARTRAGRVWRLLGRRWPMRRGSGGDLGPDFRPIDRGSRLTEGPAEERIVVVYPPWAVTR